MNRTACLLFSCPDKAGIIAHIVSFFTLRGLSISRFEEYTDAGRFFSRLEWQVEDEDANPSEFNEAFQTVSDGMDAEFRFHFFSEKQKLGLFVSHEPHALIEVLNKHEAGDYPNTEISFVIGNRESVRHIVERHEIPFHFVKTWKDPAKHEPQQLEIIQLYQPDLIGLARYMKVVTADFIDSTNYERIAGPHERCSATKRSLGHDRPGSASNALGSVVSARGSTGDGVGMRVARSDLVGADR